MKKSKKIQYLILFFLSMIWLFPVLVTITNSFMSEKEIITNYTANRTIFDVFANITNKFIKMKLIPEQMTLKQYTEILFFQPAYTVLTLNSIKLTITVVIGNVFISLLTAYGFTMWKWKYKEVIFGLYMIVMLMPLQAVLVPNYLVANILNMKDSYLTIILPAIFSSFGTFLLRKSMNAIPVEYLEAAAVDGASMIENLYLYYGSTNKIRDSGIMYAYIYRILECSGTSNCSK